MALRRPLRPQPGQALACLAIFVATFVLGLVMGVPYLWLLGLVGGVFVPPNVLLGGAWNDSPLDLPERISEFRRLGFEKGTKR